MSRIKPITTDRQILLSSLKANLDTFKAPIMKIYDKFCKERGLAPRPQKNFFGTFSPCLDFNFVRGSKTPKGKWYE